MRQPEDRQAWQRLVELFTPLLYSWTRRLGVPPQDAGDLVQDVLTVLVQKLPKFNYDPRRRFRGWLWTILRNKWRDAQRRRQAAPVEVNEPCLAELHGPEEIQEVEEVEYRQHLIARAMRLLRAEFQPDTWQACWDLVVSGRPAAEVADKFGMTVGAVYVAKSRVLKRLRQELVGLLD